MFYTKNLLWSVELNIRENRHGVEVWGLNEVQHHGDRKQLSQNLNLGPNSKTVLNLLVPGMPS